MNVDRVTHIISRAPDIRQMGWRERYASPVPFRLADVPLLFAEAYRRGVIRGYPDCDGFTLSCGTRVRPLVPVVMIVYNVNIHWAQGMEENADGLVKGKLGKVDEIHSRAVWNCRDEQACIRLLAPLAGKDAAVVTRFYREVELARVVARGILSTGLR